MIHSRPHSEGNLYSLDGKLLYYVEDLYCFVQEATYTEGNISIAVWFLSNFEEFTLDPDTIYEVSDCRRVIHYAYGSQLSKISFKYALPSS
jgi:hypothetical protein